MTFTKLILLASWLAVSLPSSLPSAMLEALIFSDGFESGNAAAWQTQLTVRIVMDATTVAKLLDGGFRLYGFKAVGSTDGGGAPLVWFSTAEFSLDTFVTWSSSLSAFTSQSAIENGRQIRIGATTGIAAGQLWQVDATGTGPVFIDGVAGAVVILNASSTDFVTGLAQNVLDPPVPMAPQGAFPLYPAFADALVPLEKVLLIFSTNQVMSATAATGTFLDLPCNACPPGTRSQARTATSPGVLIDLAGRNELTVNFGILDGWSWEAGVEARLVSPVEDLPRLLIEPR